MLYHYSIYYNDQFLFSTSASTTNTSTVWHNERDRTMIAVQVNMLIMPEEFDNALYKVKKIEPTKEQQIGGLLKGMKASDIELLKEYFKRDQNALV